MPPFGYSIHKSVHLSLSCTAFLLAGLSPLLPVRFAQAQELERIALTEPPEDDGDYPLMGEFSGPIRVADSEYKALGLQIRPIGNDRFEALQFAGGLPGEGDSTEQPEATQLIGRRAGDLIVLSGGQWAVFVQHDHCLIVDREGNRVGRLERVERLSPTLNAKPPEEALVMFDGSDTGQFSGGEITSESWLKEGADFKPMFQDFNLHLEFRLPYMPHSDGQQRGNSGCYLQSRYEVQILDSFALPSVFNGCGSLYRTKKPDVNMCFPPLVWQTYDIMFTAPRWNADGSKRSHARITVWHNGVKTHDDYELENKTGAGKEEEPTLLPIRLQDHRDPVRFRNIWVIDRGLKPGSPFPIEGSPDNAPTSPSPDSAAGNDEPTVEAVEDAQEESSQDVPKVGGESNGVDGKVDDD